MHSYFRFWLAFVGVLALDQLTKSWVVVRSLELRSEPIVLIDFLSGPEALLEFTYVTNPGAAWSLFSEYPETLTVLACAALASIYFFRKNLELHRFSLQWVFGVISGGIAGNLSDRLFREPAEVVDFIDVYLPLIEYDYPIFNVADSALFLAVCSYLILGILDSRKMKSPHPVSEPPNA